MSHAKGAVQGDETESGATDRDWSTAEAARLMLRFSERTGVGSARPAQRYLWTDAFAVCNFLALERATGERRYLERALELVDQVHRVLGRHRSDDSRVGWISGLDEQEGASHPTCGGLRIGKELPERRPGERFDERLEWERDGQYFHYLTRWMHALDQVARSTREPRFNLWARELAVAAHRAFAYGPKGRGRRRMVWKMSADLSRPLVPSMGQHDPLDGFITCLELQATADRLAGAAEGPQLEEAMADFALLLEGVGWATRDPLGIGGLLVDASRLAQLIQREMSGGAELLEGMLVAALQGLSEYSRQGDFEQPAYRRLPFREIGLAIGLSGVELIRRSIAEASPDVADSFKLKSHLAVLTSHVARGDAIEAFWLSAEHQQARTWSEHRDINEVMLATRLLPDGYLRLSD
jgi:hypothetical protein